LQGAWDKYGANSFEFKIIERCREDRLLQREQYYMYHYNSCNNLSGFNLATRATGGSGTKMSEQAKEAFRLRVIGNTFRCKYEDLLPEFISLTNQGVPAYEIVKLFNLCSSQIVNEYLIRAGYKKNCNKLKPYIHWPSLPARFRYTIFDLYLYFNFRVLDFTINDMLIKVYKECFNIFIDSLEINPKKHIHKRKGTHLTSEKKKEYYFKNYGLDLINQIMNRLEAVKNISMVSEELGIGFTTIKKMAKLFYPDYIPCNNKKYSRGRLSVPNQKLKAKNSLKGSVFNNAKNQRGKSKSNYEKHESI